MADVLSFKINELSKNVEWLNSRVSKIGKKNWENWFISQGKYENCQNCE